MNNKSVLEVRDLKVQFHTEDGKVNAADGVNLSINKGDLLGIVGESGSGKSVTGLAIMGLIQSPGRIEGGEIWYRNKELAEYHKNTNSIETEEELINILSLPDSERQKLRGDSFSMIFQDPMTSFNPSYTVGEQIAEAVEVQQRTKDQGGNEYKYSDMVLSPIMKSKRFVSSSSKKRAIELLDQVGISDPEERVDDYPNQYSGGMLQRAMIAMALASDPDILIADEPTSALDVTIQSQILELLSKVQEGNNMSIIMITHNLGVVARVANRVGVMYAGEIVEKGNIERIIDEPIHPYTKGLINSVPEIGKGDRKLEPIDGNIPSLLDSEMGNKCYFADRCPESTDECYERKPPEEHVIDDHYTKCILARESMASSPGLNSGGENE